MKRKFNWKRLVVGLLILVVAFVILGGILKWFKSEYVLAQYWPVLLIFTGFLSMNPGNVGSNAFSFGIMILGLLILLRNYGFLANGGSEVALLILLVIVGIGLISFAFEKPTSKQKEHYVEQAQYDQAKKLYNPENARPPQTIAGSDDRMIDDSKF
jgi:uncharacterized membrane protein